MLTITFSQMKLEIPCHYECVSIARIVTTKLAQIIGFSRQEEFKLQLAVDEACTNIIDAAVQAGARDCLIKLIFAPIDEGLEVIIENQGFGFDPAAVKKPSFREFDEITVEKGRGLFLMSRLMDDFEINSSPSGTKVRLVKKIV